MVHGVVHYGVANMPGAVPRTGTAALTNATLPYTLVIGLECHSLRDVMATPVTA